MTYDTINWELEAKRVSRAFGDNHLGSNFTNKELKVIKVNTCLGRCRIEYSCLAIFIEWVNWNGVVTIYLEIPFDAQPTSAHLVESCTQQEVIFLARALFHLDLLTSEVEAALKVSISAHEKLEWTLEYEARLNAPQPS